MAFAIGYLIFSAAAWVAVMASMRKAPTDVELWGVRAWLMESDPETRAKILERHPELFASATAPQETVAEEQEELVLEEMTAE